MEDLLGIVEKEFDYFFLNGFEIESVEEPTSRNAVVTLISKIFNLKIHVVRENSALSLLFQPLDLKRANPTFQTEAVLLAAHPNLSIKELLGNSGKNNFILVRQIFKDILELFGKNKIDQSIILLDEKWKLFSKAYWKSLK